MALDLFYSRVFEVLIPSSLAAIKSHGETCQPSAITMFKSQMHSGVDGWKDSTFFDDGGGWIV